MLRFLSLLWIFILVVPAVAQDRRPSTCFAIADATPGIEYLQKAGFHDPVAPFGVRISYLDHSQFLLQTPGGLSVVTDYNGFIGSADFIPDVVTMNRAHRSHWTPVPDPAIANALRGWPDATGPADHYLDLGEMLVRNVTTDIRSPFDAGIEKDGNSIFVFEAEGLCIGHLGHLHHEPTEAQYAALGRLDVVMAAVDGGLTVDLPTMIRIIKRLRSSIVLPMHWFNDVSLERFLAGVGDEFDITRAGETSLRVSLDNLPSRPTVIVLRPRFLRATE